MSLVRLAGGRIIDPANGRRGEVADLHVRDGRIVAAPEPGTRIDTSHDLAGRIVMPGGIDIHSHLAGGKVNLARALMSEDHDAHPLERRDGRRSGGGVIAPSSFAAGYRYAELGYTAAFEPAMVPSNARHAHAELADTPLVDKGCYVMLGNDDLLLRLLAENAEPAVIADYVGWMIEATQSLAVKVVNPGGISAFKFNGRDLRFDQPGPHYAVTPRRVLAALARAVHDLGIAHPLHVHCNQLGVPGNLATTLATMAAAEGLRLHLTHLQFHSYGAEGDRHFSSGAAEIAERVNANPQISVDVGQVAFGQTITASGDTMMQYRNHRHAHPRKWLCMDIECDGGCGLVPFRYRDQSFVNALQWAIGLELFLLVEDPWRIFLTTDHPNGAPFATYPHLIRLLMDRAFRQERLAAINPAAAKASRLGTIEREYDLNEIAIITRAGPARSLGLADRGHLGVGAVADITVYQEQADKQAMFERPTHVFKDGVLVARDGALREVTWGATHVSRAEFDRGIETRIIDHFARFMTVRAGNFRIADDEIAGRPNGRLARHDARRAR
jgi:formylmethanofuran dehydrogenase subunit A